VKKDLEKKMHILKVKSDGTDTRQMEVEAFRAVSSSDVSSADGREQRRRRRRRRRRKRKKEDFSVLSGMKRLNILLC